MSWWEKLTSKNKPEDTALAEHSDMDEVTLPPGATNETNGTQEQKPMTTTTNDTKTPPAPATPHPVLTAALAAGVTTPEQFAALQVRAANGDVYAKEVGETLSAQGIRLFGQEKGVKHAAAMAHLPIGEQKSVAQSWQEQADAKFGIGKDGTPATRTTATAALAQSVPAENAHTDSAKAWDRLTADQQKHGAKMGMDTDTKRESFAGELLKGAK